MSRVENAAPIQQYLSLSKLQDNGFIQNMLHVQVIRVFELMSDNMSFRQLYMTSNAITARQIPNSKSLIQSVFNN